MKIDVIELKENQTKLTKKSIHTKVFYVTDTTTNKYDIKGNKIEQKFIQGNYWTKTIYKYDDNNNEIEDSTYGDANSVNKYTYDSNNNLVELKTFSSGKLFQTISYKYDKYDKEGNWLNKITKVNNTGDRNYRKRNSILF